MKAALIERPGVLRVGEVPEPQPGDYDAVCRMLYGAVCTGTDLHLLAGEVIRPVRYPTILGHESVGRVVAVGKCVRHFRPGDLVARVRTYPPPGSGLDAHWGGFVEYGIARDHRAMKEDGLPRHRWSRFRANQVIPPDIDPAAATMTITWRETLSYLKRMGVRGGSRVLLIGSGGNALAFAAHARNLGAACIAMVGSHRRKPHADQVGVTHFFDYKADDAAAALQDSYPRGFDFILDVIGSRGVVNEFLPTLKPGGTLAVYGLDDRQFHHEPVTLTPRRRPLVIRMASRLRRLTSRLAASLSAADASPARQAMAALAIRPELAPGPLHWHEGGADEAEVHQQVIAQIQSGRLTPQPWLNTDRPFPLERIADAFDALRQRKMVKALIDLSPDRAKSRIFNIEHGM